MDTEVINASEIKAIIIRENNDDWLIYEDAAKFLGVSKRTMFRYRNNGELACAKNGRKIYFKKSDLVAFIKSHYEALEQSSSLKSGNYAK
jgi:excisionase family DNA binding protein